MTDLQRNTDHQCQCAQCRASRALDVLRALPSLPDDGRAALDTIEAALNELEESGFARWEAMNDVATAAGLNWMDATQQDIVDAIKQARARVAELEAARRFKRGYPDKPGMYIVRRADGTVGTARYYTDGWNWGAFNTDITQWAEMPEEPTP